MNPDPHAPQDPPQDPSPDPSPEEAEAMAAKGEFHEEDGDLPPDALFHPDDPIATAEGDIPPDAFFSPDDPIVRTFEGEGVVTGMAGASNEFLPTGRDMAWQIQRTANILESLADALRENGMEALRVHPDTDPMDGMLRSFVAGYLVGRLDIRE